jgi:hypothetical protein
MSDSNKAPGPSEQSTDERTAAAAGSRGHSSRSAQAQLDRHAPALISKTIDLAHRGNVVALRLCVERILPPRKDRPVAFDLPAIESAADAAKILGAVIAAMARGDVTPSQVNEIARPIDLFLKALITARIEGNLADLQKSLGEGESSHPGRTQ